MVLKRIPVLNDLSDLIETEDVYPGVLLIGPGLLAVEHCVVAIS